MQSRENPWGWFDCFGKEYGFRNGPSIPEANKVNCQWVVHWVLSSVFEFPIPDELLSSEFYAGYKPYFREIDTVRKTNNGDVYLFGPQNLTDYKKLHLAIQIGSFGVEKIPVLLHSTKIENGVVAWELPIFSVHDQYRQIYGKRRPNFERSKIA